MEEQQRISIADPGQSQQFGDPSKVNESFVHQQQHSNRPMSEDEVKAFLQTFPEFKDCNFEVEIVQANNSPTPFDSETYGQDYTDTSGDNANRYIEAAEKYNIPADLQEQYMRVEGELLQDTNYAYDPMRSRLLYHHAHAGEDGSYEGLDPLLLMNQMSQDYQLTSPEEELKHIEWKDEFGQPYRPNFLDDNEGDESFEPITTPGQQQQAMSNSFGQKQASSAKPSFFNTDHSTYSAGNAVIDEDDSAMQTDTHNQYKPRPSNIYKIPPMSAASNQFDPQINFHHSYDNQLMRSKAELNSNNINGNNFKTSADIPELSKRETTYGQAASLIISPGHRNLSESDVKLTANSTSIMGNNKAEQSVKPSDNTYSTGVAPSSAISKQNSVIPSTIHHRMMAMGSEPNESSNGGNQQQRYRSEIEMQPQTNSVQELTRKFSQSLNVEAQDSGHDDIGNSSKNANLTNFSNKTATAFALTGNTSEKINDLENSGGTNATKHNVNVSNLKNGINRLNEKKAGPIGNTSEYYSINVGASKQTDTILQQADDSESNEDLSDNNLKILADNSNNDEDQSMKSTKYKEGQVLIKEDTHRHRLKRPSSEKHAHRSRRHHRDVGMFERQTSQQHVPSTHRSRLYRRSHPPSSEVKSTKSGKYCYIDGEKYKLMDFSRNKFKSSLPYYPNSFAAISSAGDHSTKASSFYTVPRKYLRGSAATAAVPQIYPYILNAPSNTTMPASAYYANGKLYNLNNKTPGLLYPTESTATLRHHHHTLPTSDSRRRKNRKKSNATSTAVTYTAPQAKQNDFVMFHDGKPSASVGRKSYGHHRHPHHGSSHRSRCGGGEKLSSTHKQPTNLDMLFTSEKFHSQQPTLVSQIGGVHPHASMPIYSGAGYSAPANLHFNILPNREYYNYSMWA